MDTKGRLRPATADAARETYAELTPAAKVATREATKAMGFDSDEYDERVTSGVIESVRDAIFASLLEVHVAERSAFDGWLDGRDATVVLAGSDRAPRVVWHDPAMTDTVVAATFGDERAAAVGTLRRQAFGRVYRELLETAGE